MAVQCSSLLARRLALGVAGSALALLAGCVVAPAQPYEVGTPVVVSAYPATTYYDASTTHSYYGWPAYSEPSLSLGLYGWHGGRQRGRDWNRPGWSGGRPGWSGGRPGWSGGRPGWSGRR